MRLPAMVTYIRTTFPEIIGNPEAAIVFAAAMTEADHQGWEIFTYNGVEYTMRAVFDHGCYKGGCNPATCYKNWTLDTVPDVG